MKIDPDGNWLGAVYEEDGTFYYECEHCCTMFSGPNEYRVELKADQHESWHQKQVDQQHHPCPVCGWDGGFHDPKVHPVKVPDRLIIKPAIKPITRFWYAPDTTEYL